jgi:hypothetical protein
MVAVAPNEEEARYRLVRDVEHHGLRVSEVANEREVFAAEEIEESTNTSQRTFEP